MVRKLSSRRLAPTLPGLMRYLARARAQAGYFVSRRWPLYVEVADHRYVDLVDDVGDARAAASLFTVTRTSSLPA